MILKLSARLIISLSLTLFFLCCWLEACELTSSVFFFVLFLMRYLLVLARFLIALIIFCFYSPQDINVSCIVCTWWNIYLMAPIFFHWCQPYWLVVSRRKREEILVSNKYIEKEGSEFTRQSFLYWFLSREEIQYEIVNSLYNFINVDASLDAE